MPSPHYENMQALIIDDFDSFRIALYKMLQDFGITKIDMAASSSEAQRFCNLRTYDIILCDQNLGKGKTGQQILELLRHTPNPNSNSLFLLVSAESNKSIIMAAYDYEPDAYLAKPITAQTLGQRLERLFTQRVLLAPIYDALRNGEGELAIELCQREISGGNRYSSFCQKTLGRLLLDAGRYGEAEELYRQVLEIRQLDWAMLGMAQAKKYQGDSLSAQQWLEEIIQFNPMCLKAYDVLAEVMSERGDHAGRQKFLQQALELSPLSVVRQQALGEVAFKNNDLVNSTNAYRKAIRLGENSCHDHVGVHKGFARASIQLAKIDHIIAKPVVRDAIKVVTDIPARFGKTVENKVDSHLLESQLQQVSGEDRKGKEAFVAAKRIIDTTLEPLSLGSRIELVNALREQGNRAEADAELNMLLADFANDEESLQKIDTLLDEPRSVKNKTFVAKINREGIGWYDAGEYRRAVDCFTSALQEFPQHVGLRLNLIQALLGEAKQTQENAPILASAQQIFDYVKPLLTIGHAQYPRYRQLEDAMRSLANRPAKPAGGLYDRNS